jgi:hypothetical protein
MRFSYLHTNLKIHVYKNLILAFAVIHGWPFWLSYYCGIGDLQIFASATGSVFLLYYPIVTEQRFSIDGKYYPILTLWRRNFLLNFSALCI